MIRLDPESPREERLTDAEKERKLFDTASPHLRGVITAMLETCCRPGEILRSSGKTLISKRVS